MTKILTNKIFQRAVVFAIGLALLFIGLTRLLVPKTNSTELALGTKFANGILGEPENTIDVVMLGNSRIYTAICPMDLWDKHGITSYICGTPGQAVSDSVLFLEKACKIQKPKLVILGADNIFDGMGISTYYFSKLKDKVRIFQYHNRWKSLGWEDFYKKPTNDWTDTNKGFNYSTFVSAAPEKPNFMKDKGAPPKEISYVSLRCLKDIQAICASVGAKLLIVSTPNWTSWSVAKNRAMEIMCRDFKIDFVDMNLGQYDAKINWQTDTRDKGDHLNYAGATKVTDIIAEYLHKNYELPDHRKDSKFDAWHKAYESHLVMTNKKPR